MLLIELGHLGSSAASHSSQTESQCGVVEPSKAWWQTKSGLCITVAITLGEFRSWLWSESSRLNTRGHFSWLFRATSHTCGAVLMLEQTQGSAVPVPCIQGAALSASTGGRESQGVVGLSASKETWWFTSTAAFFWSLFPDFGDNLLITEKSGPLFVSLKFLFLGSLEQ